LVVGVLAGLALWFAPTGAARAAAAEDAVNACGCGRDLTGSCVCQKVARCGCPGECEPVGCEEKRAKQLEREIMAETKRAADEDRKRNSVPAGHSTELRDTADGRHGGERAKSNEAARPKTMGRLDAASAVTRMPKKMTASQKRELAQLLEAYLAEYPELRGHTIEQLRGELD
jgi:hypothetical protein